MLLSRGPNIDPCGTLEIISSQLSLSIMFLMLTTLFSTHGFQHISFPFTQHNLTSESHLQYTKSIETRPFKATNTSFKILLNKTHPNYSKRGMASLDKLRARVDKTCKMGFIFRELKFCLLKSKKLLDLQIYDPIGKTMKKLYWIPNTVLNTSTILIFECL